MSYEMPTLDQFVETYPEFATEPSSKINRALTRAARQVDETWTEEDYQEAIMAVAAHLLASRNAGIEAAGQDDLKSISIGPLSLTYGDKIRTTDYTTTSYGQDYIALRDRNVGGPVAI